MHLKRTLALAATLVLALTMAAFKLSFQFAPSLGIKLDVTLWAIARRFHGDAALDWYVDELVELNGSASIEAGQQITLP